MQVSSINSYDATNFKALKRIDIIGKNFKKSPLTAKEILQNVKENKNFQEFCKHWDVSIGLFSRNYDYSGVESTLAVAYKSIEKSGFMNSIRSLFRRNKQISVSGFGSDFLNSINELNSNVGFRGVLDGQIEYVNKTEAEKAAKLMKKFSNKSETQKIATEDNTKKQKEELNSFIDNMINQ